MDERIRSILIVGGGTAGWLSAAYLERALGDTTRITLVEASNIDRIGVGEATLPSLRHTLRFIGAPEEEWMPRCNATFKAAIRFTSWLEGKGEHFYHSFSKRPEPLANPYPQPYFMEIGGGFSLIHYWLKKRLANETDEPYAYAVDPGPALWDAKRAPIQDVASAHHLDAGLLAGYLRELATGRGVQHVIGEVEHVELDDRGRIARIRNTDGRVLEADFFIDCTGFSGRLINGVMGAEFESDNASLLCDSAVAISARNDPENDGIAPYTTATALSSGWVWDIPLFHRRGTGYVYSSRFLSRDAAEAELRRFLGPACEGMPANHIRMRVGRNRRMWIENCLAIGLSSCFIEPLESTGIFLTEAQLWSLVTLFPDRHFDPALIAKYQATMSRFYEDQRDFVLMHYVLSRREDTAFWRAVKNETVVPDSLREKMELFGTVFPVMDALQLNVFPGRSYASILAGMDALPRRPYPILEHTNLDVGERMLADVKRQTQRLLETLPDHYAYLKTLHGRAGTTA